jgi:hypothetical protein
MVAIEPYNTQFTLSRDYLAECFDQSLPYGKSAKPNFLFPTLLFASGVYLLVYTDQSRYLGLILIALAVLELIHIRFRRAWWLARQMWGRSANSEVTLNVDEQGVRTQNPYTETVLLWTDVERVIETDLGLILVVKQGGQQYLSKSLFPVELISLVIALNKE